MFLSSVYWLSFASDIYQCSLFLQTEAMLWILFYYVSFLPAAGSFGDGSSVLIPSTRQRAATSVLLSFGTTYGSLHDTNSISTTWILCQTRVTGERNEQNQECSRYLFIFILHLCFSEFVHFKCIFIIISSIHAVFVFFIHLCLKYLYEFLYIV